MGIIPVCRRLTHLLDNLSESIGFSFSSFSEVLPLLDHFALPQLARNDVLFHTKGLGHGVSEQI